MLLCMLHILHVMLKDLASLWGWRALSYNQIKENYVLLSSFEDL